MDNKIGSIVVLVVVIVVLLFVFRGCKNLNIRQKSDDTKTEVSFELKKEKDRY